MHNSVCGHTEAFSEIPKGIQAERLGREEGSGSGKNRKKDRRRMVMEVRQGYKERSEEKAEWSSRVLQFKLKINLKQTNKRENPGKSIPFCSTVRRSRYGLLLMIQVWDSEI